MKTKHQKPFVDLLEDLLIFGLEPSELSARAIREKFRNDPVAYITSLILILKEKEESEGWFVSDIIFEIEKNLKKAREFLLKKSLAK